MSIELTSQQHEWDLSGPAPAKPAMGDYGYITKGQAVGTTREELIEAVQHNPAIRYVWTPDTPEPVLPPTVPFLLEAFRRKLRRNAHTTILIGIALVLFAFAIALVAHNWNLLYRNLFFVIGGVFLIEGIWQYARLRRYTAEEALSDASAARFAEWLGKKPLSGYTFMLAACI